MGRHLAHLDMLIAPQVAIWLQFLLATPVVLWAGGRSSCAAGSRW